MASIKLEDNIKQKLEERTIKPSNNSWDSLAGKLDANDKKSNPKLFWWFGVAASIVGVFFVITMLFKDDEVKTLPVVVEQPTEDTIKSKEVLNNNNVVEEQVATIEEDVKNEVVQSQVIQKQIINKPKEQVVSASTDKEEAKEKDVFLEQSETHKSIIPEEAVAQIDNEKVNEMSVEDEVNKLLQEAKDNMDLDIAAKGNNRLVDANSLLESVEDDLDESFRDKVFEALKSSYKTVKTAVAERND